VLKAAIAFLLLSMAVFAQDVASKPQVRVNYLNVCAPSDVETREIASVLARIPRKPAFAADFEVSRGRSSVTESDLQLQGMQPDPSQPPSVSRWVRIRREFPESSPIQNVQYSFSTSEGRATETLVFRLRDQKDVMQVSLSDAITARSDPASVLAVDTPANRIRLERFGKSSIVLARCPAADQAAYQAHFANASDILATYRASLAVRKTVVDDLARISDLTPKTAPAMKQPGRK
jgi:hypothetical protein